MMELPDPNSDFGEAYALTWARCPYPAELCGADAVFEPGGVDADDNVTGVVTCHNGHRWSVARLADHGEYVGVEGENP